VADGRVADGRLNGVSDPEPSWLIGSRTREPAPASLGAAPMTHAYPLYLHCASFIREGNPDKGLSFHRGRYSDARCPMHARSSLKLISREEKINVVPFKVKSYVVIPASQP
jgi:hypothetical protein